MACNLLTHKDYTLGWVCALSKEQTAAVAMLDEQHEDLPKPVNDHNTYTLGRVGKHNVVIACLPKGIVGNNSSATVATRMVATFPSIKFGLMVGIGGGVPPKVRLGDVVVSSPVGEYSGVVQWDFGKAEQGGTFKRTGALNNPPNALLTALAKLETKHELKGSDIPKYLEELETNWPKLAAKYTRSKTLEDILFRANYNHIDKKPMDAIHTPVNAEESGNEDDWENEEEEEQKSCPYCDRTKVVKRKPRDMQIHYGLIASGNQVIKDGAFRNQVNKQLGGNVLCFEMEAAGLVNDFRCLVIRGICDYADSHKNTDWQEHAAVVAAAFAKEFLLTVQEYEVEQLSPLSAIITNIVDNTNFLRDVHIDAEHKDALDWLSSVDHWSNYESACDKRKDTPTTGNWLLTHSDYEKWIEGQVSMLWLYGIPGCGKTVLSSKIIEGLSKRDDQDSNIRIAFFYFDFSDPKKQSVDGCLRCLLRQLDGKGPPASVMALYEQYRKDNRNPSIPDLHDTLRKILEKSSPTFLVLDALDECNDVEKLMQTIQIIHEWALPHVRILATSREQENIKKTIADLGKQICLETEVIDKDIGTFVAQSFESGSSLAKWSENKEARHKIETGLLAISKGMFRLAKCQLDELQNCNNLYELEEAMKSLPKDLNNMYSRILGKINEKDRRNVLRALQWLVHALRPLRMEELRQVLAINVEEHPRFNPKKLFTSHRDILRICSSLVTTTADGRLALAHLSVREYLVSGDFCIDEYLGSNHLHARDYSITILPANLSMADVCVAYILQLDKVVPISSFFGHYSWKQDVVKEFPFAEYAAEYWTEHARKAEKEGIAPRLAEEFFLHKKDAYATWVYLSSEPGLYREPGSNFESPLYRASGAGLVESVKMLLREAADVNEAGTPEGDTALAVASENGHIEIVKRLIEAGADPNICAKGRVPHLVDYLMKDYQRFARRLEKEIRRHRGPNAEDIRGTWTPITKALTRASRNGHYQIVRELLKAGAQPNDGLYCFPLCFACRDGVGDIVKLLLENKANPNGRGVDGWYDSEPLLIASKNGDYQIVQQLLAAGAHVSGSQCWPLFFAAKKGDKKIVDLLLKAGANPNALGETPDMMISSGESAFEVACEYGHYDIAKELIKAGTVVNLHATCLHAATSRGHDNVVQLLIENGVELNKLDPNTKRAWKKMQCYATALHLAAEYGYYDIARRLLEAGADVDARSDNPHLGYFTALEAALKNGHHNVTQLLLKWGATDGDLELKGELTRLDSGGKN